jgi:hypothetical protein
MMNLKCSLGINRFAALFLIFLCVLLTGFPSLLSAKVTGKCIECHTMHSSQSPSPSEWTGKGWTPGITQGYLLVTGCIGCHSSDTNDTIITLVDGSRIPIVYNTKVPNQPLAGGNFYWLENTLDTEQEADARGHNVRDIDGNDSNLDFAPGGSNVEGIECGDCHLPRHHANDSQTVVDATGGWYRFLPNVKGIEDPDWEQTKSHTKHNEYKGGRPSSEKSMSNFCNGCHPVFYTHAEIGDSSPWLRHPSDEILPGGSEKEYSDYTQYDPLAPVARPDLSDYTGPSSMVTAGEDMVMCLSCHRPHATPNADILRWNYSTCVAGPPTNSECGCFVCHTEKDG